MDFDANGNLYVISQDFDGNILIDSSQLPTTEVDADNNNIPQPTDVALISIDKDSGKFIAPEGTNFFGSDVKPITLGGYEVIGDYLGMAFHEDGSIYATYQQEPDDGVTELHQLNFGDFSSTAVVDLIGEVTLGSTATDVQALAFAVDADGTQILVGIDHADDD